MASSQPTFTPLPPRFCPRHRYWMSRLASSLLRALRLKCWQKRLWGTERTSTKTFIRCFLRVARKVWRDLLLCPRENITLADFITLLCCNPSKHYCQSNIEKHRKRATNTLVLLPSANVFVFTLVHLSIRFSVSEGFSSCCKLLDDCTVLSKRTILSP